MSDKKSRFINAFLTIITSFYQLNLFPQLNLIFTKSVLSKGEILLRNISRHHENIFRPIIIRSMLLIRNGKGEWFEDDLGSATSSSKSIVK